MTDLIREGHQRYHVSREDLDVAVDQLIKDGLKTGYEDYYPGQVAQARGLLFGLCERVLSRATLEAAPCEDDPAHRALVAVNASDAVKRAVDDYLVSSTRQSSLSKVGFFAPLWSLLEDRSWSSRDWETYWDWFGWIVAWSIRLVALVVGVAAIWAGPGAVAVTAFMMLGASGVSAVTTTIRQAIAACGFYPYSTAYPRDVVALQGVLYAMVFRPAGERFEAEQLGQIVKGETYVPEPTAGPLDVGAPAPPPPPPPPTH
jgi:hypothetical protein